MNVLVIENEKLQIQKIKDLLYEIDDSIRVVGVTDDMLSAASWLKQNNAPDLILANADVMTGVQQHVQGDIRARVTISTRLEEFNFEALRFKHLRSILNDLPENGERIAWNHTASSSGEMANSKTEYRERFLVKQGQKLLSIPVTQVAYFFSQERFIFLKTLDNQKFLVEYRIEKLEKMLSPALFFRVNRSMIISLPTVKEIHAYFGNRLKLYLVPAAEKEVIVSRKRVHDFKDWLGR